MNTFPWTVDSLRQDHVISFFTKLLGLSILGITGFLIFLLIEIQGDYSGVSSISPITAFIILSQLVFAACLLAPRTCLQRHLFWRLLFCCSGAIFLCRWMAITINSLLNSYFDAKVFILLAAVVLVSAFSIFYGILLFSPHSSSTESK
jgi:hypothetical protein